MKKKVLGSIYGFTFKHTHTHTYNDLPERKRRIDFLLFFFLILIKKKKSHLIRGKSKLCVCS